MNAQSRNGCVVGAAVVVLGLIASCGDSSNGTGGTTTSGDGGSTSAGGDPFVPKKIGGSIKTTVGPSGGNVKSVDGHLTLEIPAGALTESREIEVQQIEVKGGFGWSLGPNGTKFAVPAKVALTLSAAEAGARDLGTEQTSTAESAPGVSVLHMSDPADSTDGPIPLRGGWDPSGSQMRFTGEIAHFSELVVRQVQRHRFVYPASVAVGEKTFVQVTEIGEAPFEERDVFLKCAGETRSRVLRTPVRLRMRDLSLRLNPVIVTPAPATALDGPGVSGFKIDMTCSASGKHGFLAAIDAFFERESGQPWPSGCEPEAARLGIDIYVECTAPTGIAGRYLLTEAPGSCDDDPSSAAWYVHPNGAITNDFTTTCQNTAGKSFATPDVVWELSNGTLTLEDCARKVDPMLGAKRVLTFNEAKQRWEGTMTNSSGTVQSCLKGPEPWNFTGKCALAACTTVNLTCGGQPKTQFLNCGSCNDSCEGCSATRPWPWEASLTPQCF